MFKIRYGKASPKETRSADGHVPVFGSAGEMARTTTALVSDPCIVIGRKGNVGQTHLVMGGAWPTDTTYYITMTPEIDPKFLQYQLVALDLRRLDSSTATPSLRRQDLESVQITWPKLNEQLRIVEVLEDHLSRLDAADRALRASLTRLDRLVPSVLAQHLHSMHERGVPLGAIGDLADTALGKMLDAKRLGGTPTRYLANINVRWGSFELDHLKEVPLTDVERRKFELRPGDILACEGGEPGRCAVWQLEKSDIAYQKALHRIRVRNKNALEPRFLALMLQEGIQSNRWNSLFTGTTIKHLPQEKLRRITVPIPPISTQLSIVDEVADTQQHMARLARATAEARARGMGLRQAVLAAAFRGKLTGRRIDQEISEELAAIPAGPSEAMATA